VTKLDVLSGLDKVPLCVGYEIDGVRTDEMPMTQTAFHHARPVYEEHDGWWEDISKCRVIEELPDNARRYLERIEELCGTRVAVAGVGPGREENVILHQLLRP
jgi:adenylosuccinate synthase